MSFDILIFSGNKWGCFCRIITQKRWLAKLYVVWVDFTK